MISTLSYVPEESLQAGLISHSKAFFIPIHSKCCLIGSNFIAEKATLKHKSYHRPNTQGSLVKIL